MWLLQTPPPSEAPTVKLEPGQLQTIIEQGQANTWFLLGGMSVIAAWLFALLIVLALKG